MNHKIALLIITCFVNAIFLTGQDLSEDLQKMSKTYADANTFQTHVDVKVYEGKKFVMSKKAIIKKTEKNYFYVLDDISVLLNEKYSMMINESDKIIVFGTVEQGSSDLYAAVTQFKVEEMDAQFRQNEHWEYRGTSNDQKQYVLSDEDGMIKKTELFMDAENHTINKVVYHYNEDEGGGANRVVITYNDTQINPRFSENTFSESKYIIKQNGKWVATSSFQNYELIDISEEG